MPKQRVYEPGIKTNRLTYIRSVNKDGRWYGLFLCDCGKYTEVRPDMVFGNRTKSCGCKSNVSGYKKEIILYGDDYGYFITWKRYRYCAEKRKIPFELSFLDIKEQYEKQNGLCAYTKQKINVPTNFTNMHTPEMFSIDRINSKLGYTKDNIHLVTKTVNMVKYTLDHDDFLQLCETIYLVNQEKKKDLNSPTQDSRFQCRT